MKKLNRFVNSELIDKIFITLFVFVGVLIGYVVIDGLSSLISIIML